jgi:negative regulator of replication initiation
MLNITTEPDMLNRVPDNMTVQDHAAAAHAAAAEAQHHLEEAKKAFQVTSHNVKETLQAGKKIKGTAGVNPFILLLETRFCVKWDSYTSLLKSRSQAYPIRDQLCKSYICTFQILCVHVQTCIWNAWT